MAYKITPLRSMTKPDVDITKTGPWALCEKDLKKELARLEALLEAGEFLPKESTRLEQVRFALAKLETLKRGSHAEVEARNTKQPRRSAIRGGFKIPLA
jgi:ribosomal protein L29